MLPMTIQQMGERIIELEKMVMELASRDERFEVTEPLRKDDTNGRTISLPPDAFNGPVVRIKNSVPINGYYDCVILERDQGNGAWIERGSAWAELENSTLNSLKGDTDYQGNLVGFERGRNLYAIHENKSEVVKITTGTLENGTYDALIQIRDNANRIWSDGESIWAIDLAGSVSLAANTRYDGLFKGVEPTGSYILSLISNNQGHALTDTAAWLKLLSNPLSVRPYVQDIVINTMIVGAIALEANSDPGDFSALLDISITDDDASITAGTIFISGTDSNDAYETESIDISNGGTQVYTSVKTYKTVTSIAYGGIGDDPTDMIQVSIHAYDNGVLRSSSGSNYLMTGVDGTVAPPSADWTLISLTNKGRYVSTVSYSVSDYVQEVRAVYTINSDEEHQLRIGPGGLPWDMTDPSYAVSINGTFNANLLDIDPNTHARTVSTAIWCIDLANRKALIPDDDYLCHFERNGTGGFYYLSIINGNIDKALGNTNAWVQLTGDPHTVLAYVADIVPTSSLSNITYSLTAGSSPSDFTVWLVIVTTTAPSGGDIWIEGTDASDRIIFEHVGFTAGTHTNQTNKTYKTVTAIKVDGVSGGGGTIRVHVLYHPPGTLRSSGGTTYYSLGAITDPPSVEWVSVVLSDKVGYSKTTTYSIGDYVQEIRGLYTIGSSFQGISGQSALNKDWNVLGPNIIFTTNDEIGGPNGSLLDSQGDTIPGFSIDVPSPNKIRFSLPQAIAGVCDGIVSDGAQTWGGTKTFASAIGSSPSITIDPPTVTLIDGLTIVTFSIAGGSLSTWLVGTGMSDPHINLGVATSLGPGFLGPAPFWEANLGEVPGLGGVGIQRKLILANDNTFLSPPYVCLSLIGQGQNNFSAADDYPFFRILAFRAGPNNIVTFKGLWATVGGLSFSGGLYTGGSLSVNLATDVTGVLATTDGGFGADVSGYNGLPIFTSGTVSDLTHTRASGPDLELEGGSSGAWYKILSPDSY